MKNKIILTLSLSCYFACLPLEAQHRPIAEVTCNPEKWIQKKVSEWLDNVSHRLNDSATEKTRNGFKKNRVTYAFSITKKGFVKNIQKIKSSDSKKIDKLALDLIEKAVPFPTCDRVNLDLYDGVVVSFGKTIRVSLKPNDETNEMSRYVLKKPFGFCENLIKYKVPNYAEVISKPVTCKFKIDETGAVSELNIVKSSGVNSIDQECLKVLQQAAPFNQINIWNKDLIVSFQGEHVRMSYLLSSSAEKRKREFEKIFH